MSEPSIFDICVEPIELYKLLKISNLVAGGGEAKTLISEGKILVNNEVVIQKRKKIRRGDVIEHNGKVIKIAYSPSKKSAEFISKVVLASKKSKKKKRVNTKPRVSSSNTVTKPSTER